jgi:hypothetical protein
MVDLVKRAKIPAKEMTQPITIAEKHQGQTTMVHY